MCRLQKLTNYILIEEKGTMEKDITRKIILFPASGRTAQVNYNKLVKEGVNIPGDDKDKIRRIWGTTNGAYGYNLSKVKLITEGDIALFVCQKKIISCAVIESVSLNNKELANDVIKNDIWENIIFLAGIVELNIDLLEFNKVVGYSENYSVQGFNVLDEEKSEKVLDKYKEIEECFSKRQKDSKFYEEMKKKGEDEIIERKKVFISYSHDDEEYKNKLEDHLKILSYKRDLEVWDDRKLGIGDNFDELIIKKIDEVDIIVILISSSYFASNYCMKKEWNYIKEKYIGKILPVIVRDCLYDEMLEGIETITMPQNSMSLDQLLNKDREYRLIANEIRKKLYFDN